MAKHRVTVLGSVGKSILVDDTLSPRMTAAEAAILALQNSSSGATMRHSVLQGLQLGNDHPQYPLSRGRETIRGQWDFTKQIWASLGTAAAPGYAFTAAPDTGLFGFFTAGDPYFSSVVALLHFDGADGGTTFTDSSSYARAVTVTGGAITSTAHPKYGTATAKFPDSAGKATFADAAETRIATGDWTIEFWVYKSVNNADIQIKKNNFTSVYPMQFLLGGAGNISANGADGTGVGVYSLSGSPAPIATWQHVAITRNGSTFRLFQDGVLKSSATYAGTLGENAGVWTFGTASAGDVWIDDFRFTVGVARYTAAFTPPTAALPDSGDVVYESISVDGTERFRFAQLGQLGIGGANYGTSRQSLLSGGASAAPAWSTLVHTDISDWDEAVQDTVGAFMTDSTTIDFTYSDVGNTLTAAVIQSFPYAWTGAHTFAAQAVFNSTLAVGATVAGGLMLSSAIPALYFDDSDGGANNRYYRFAANSGDFVWQVTTDANASEDFFRVTRSGGQATTMSFATGASVVKLKISTSGNTQLPADNLELQLGGSQDLRLYHDGTNSIVRNDTGELRFSLAGALSLRLADAALSFRSTTARGSGNCYINMADPTGDKGYFGYGFADDTFTLVNLLNADMTFWTNSTERMRFPAAGGMTISQQTTAATATAGARTLPANPVDFLVVTINGTSRKIPYYAT